jgi:hypothetical protein
MFDISSCAAAWEFVATGSDGMDSPPVPASSPLPREQPQKMPVHRIAAKRNPRPGASLEPLNCKFNDMAGRPIYNFTAPSASGNFRAGIFFGG